MNDITLEVAKFVEIGLFDLADKEDSFDECAYRTDEDIIQKAFKCALTLEVCNLTESIHRLLDTAVPYISKHVDWNAIAAHKPVALLLEYIREPSDETWTKIEAWDEVVKASRTDS